MLHKQVEALDQNSELKRKKKKLEEKECREQKKSLTVSQEETRRWSLWLEKRKLEMPSDGGDDSSRPGPPPIISLFSSRLVRHLFSVVYSEEKNTNGQQIPKPNCTLLLVLVLLSTESHCIQYCEATLLSPSTSENLPRKLFFFHFSVQENLAGATVALGLWERRRATQQKLRSVVSASRKDLDIWRKT